MKNRETTAPPPRERFDNPREGRDSGGGREYVPREGREYVPRSGSSSHSRPMSPGGSSAARDAAALGRKRIPPAETNAEIFYYKKQMDAHTPMVIVLLDGEEIEGTIEWYDRAALKINRRGEPNILLLKHQIKYMFKAEDRDGGGDDDDSGD
ncbi:MAG: host factor-I protein [Acidobacteriota bacterium]|nr:host factor-I protein [Acidobacteriota bacterium]